jgi:hypothetical protein
MEVTDRRPPLADGARSPQAVAAKAFAPDVVVLGPFGKHGRGR